MQTMAEKYKMTEVGLIPEDWEVKSIGNVLKIRHGKSQKDIEDKNGEYPILGTGGLMGYANHFLYDKPSVLIGRKGTIDKPQFMDSPFWTVDTLFYSEIFEGNSSKYLYYKFLQIDWYAHNEASGVPSLNANTIEKINIAVPDLPEQTAIATALSDADNYINSLEKLIAKKQAIKQGAMQKLLTPKADWVVKKLGEVGEITGAGVDKKIRPDETPVRLVNYMDVFNRDFIYSNELEHWVTARPSQAQRCAVQKGDIFFTPSSEMRFDIAISAVAMEDIPDAAYSYHLVRLRLFDNWDLNFRTYIFKQKHFLDQAETMCEGSGKRYVISLTKFREMEISFPENKEEQSHIATILSDMDADIAATEQQLAKARSIKQGMMQQLLTGKIRLDH